MIDLSKHFEVVRSSIRLGALLLFSAACAQTGLQPGSAQAPDADGWTIQQGDSIPELEFMDGAGVRHGLDEFEGRPVVLLFWGTT